MNTVFRSVFNDEVIVNIKQRLQNIRSNKDYSNYGGESVIYAFEDIIECIEKESITDDVDLEDYIEATYSFDSNEFIYIQVCKLLAFFDGEYEDVDGLFNDMIIADFDDDDDLDF